MKLKCSCGCGTIFFLLDGRYRQRLKAQKRFYAPGHFGKRCVQVCCFICKKILVRPQAEIRKNQSGKFFCFSCMSDARRGSNNFHWHGGRCIAHGYVLSYAPDHIHANHQGYVFEHRLAMEKHLGRLLTSDEVVHHINGIKHDNRLKNLRIMSKSEHSSEHSSIYRWCTISDTCLDCGSSKRPHNARGLCQMCYQRRDAKQTLKKRPPIYKAYIQSR